MGDVESEWLQWQVEISEVDNIIDRRPRDSPALSQGASH